MIRIGTRSSRLAQWQANWVAGQLRAIHPELDVELVEIKTKADHHPDSALAAIGGSGLFTTEIQRAVRERFVDIAVHSLKDLPTEGPQDLVLAAVPARANVADALIAPQHRTLEALPPGARVGTSSPRRRAQLLALRPDLEVVPIRGNVDTRLRHALDGELDAVVLAWAGLERLSYHDHVSERLEPPGFLPAVGQGALGIECRREDAATLTLLERLEDPRSRRAAEAERAMLAALQAGCTNPIAAWARDAQTADDDDDGTLLALDAAVFALDGHRRVSAALRGPVSDPCALGRRVAQGLRDQGAEFLVHRLP
jgi:hydroxymethylbilane synthase